MVYGPYKGWFSLRSFWGRNLLEKATGCRKIGPKSVIAFRKWNWRQGQDGETHHYFFLTCTRFFKMGVYYFCNLKTTKIFFIGSVIHIDVLCSTETWNIW